MAEQLLLTPEEAFEAIRVKRAKGFQMLASGELPSIRIGRLRRIPVAALHTWVKNQQQEAGYGESTKEECENSGRPQ
jgi:excisionase family DNA binding protein